MTPLLVLLALVEPPRFQQSVEQLLADPEYRHLARFREDEPPPEPSASPERRESRPSTRAPRPAPPQGGPSPSATPFVPSFDGLVAVLRLLVYAALAAALGWVLWLVVRLIRRRSHKDASADGSEGGEPMGEPSDEQTSDEALRQASAHAHAGRYREAVRFLLLGAIRVIEARGLIRPRKGLTNGDYLRAVRREPSLRGSLEAIVRAFDEIHFGRRAATAERFEECLRSYRTGFV